MALTVFNQVPMAIFAYSIPVILILGVGMYLLLELGEWIGRKHLGRSAGKLKDTFGVVDGPIFALFGLLVAFTFSSALTRFEEASTDCARGQRNRNCLSSSGSTSPV